MGYLAAFADLEDSASTLACAASSVRGLLDSADTLADATETLESLRDRVKTLTKAADRAMGAAGMLSISRF
ncbi:hypothetical protein ACH4UT_29290 [Streptomyces sp. NPDC020799]|uniref:hypothetical protein n=1 Tax=Streptomyces sp. NPDC020799 TaxID=3365091 RepID=UPI00379D2E25